MTADIRLSIERLVLDGLGLTPEGVRQVQAAFEAELTRLLQEGGLPEQWQNGGVSLPVATAQVAAGHDPAGIGQQAAQGVYNSLGGGTTFGRIGATGNGGATFGGVGGGHG